MPRHGGIPVALRPARTRSLVVRLAAVAVAISFGAFAATARAAGPVGSSPPVIGGKTVDGKRLQAAARSWSGAKPNAIAYQ